MARYFTLFSDVGGQQLQFFIQPRPSSSPCHHPDLQTVLLLLIQFSRAAKPPANLDRPHAARILLVTAFLLQPFFPSYVVYAPQPHCVACPSPLSLLVASDNRAQRHGIQHRPRQHQHRGSTRYYFVVTWPAHDHSFLVCVGTRAIIFLCSTCNVLTSLDWWVGSFHL
jgi:hypothetical protein